MFKGTTIKTDISPTTIADKNQSKYDVTLKLIILLQIKYIDIYWKKHRKTLIKVFFKSLFRIFFEVNIINSKHLIKTETKLPIATPTIPYLKTRQKEINKFENASTQEPLWVSLNLPAVKARLL